jgi:6-phosphofructokinase 1
MGKNAIVAQSGGPSPVINASLHGVLDGCRAFPDKIDHLYAAWHGIEGVLQEELIDLYRQPGEELRRLRRTPAAGAIGTCRYKLEPGQKEDFDRILDVLVAHDVGYFFYIGGNDSMDTADKLARLARERGIDLVATGVPKTIDNDVGDQEFKLLDHTPGYGSAARYWASIVQDCNEENRGMAPSECVCVLQAMGRKSGFIPAAARLADPQRRAPIQIYTAEAGHTLESLHENVNARLRADGRCIVVVSEGFEVGDLGAARDGFGHIEYGASKMAVAQIVANYLNEKGLAARGQATWQVPGVLQRNTSALASVVDMDEAYDVGRHAVAIALREGGGWMATILRRPGPAYAVAYDKVALERVANSVRHLPREWLSGDGLDVTDDFVRYAQPLIGDAWPAGELENGCQRFARLDIRFIDRVCPEYVPVKMRVRRTP